MKRLTYVQREVSRARASSGQIVIDRSLCGAQYRHELIRTGLLTPPGGEDHDVFETDDIGRIEAAHTIFFDETIDVGDGALYGFDRGTDPVVREELGRLYELAHDAEDGDPDGTGGEAEEELTRLKSVHRFKRHAWKELFPAEETDAEYMEEAS